MIPRIRIFASLCLVSALALADPAVDLGWASVDGLADTRVVARGGPRSDAGVDLHIETGRPGGAITRLDATPFRGHEVTLSGEMTVIAGDGPAFLWLRADGGYAFVNSQQAGVTRAHGTQRRKLRLYIPFGTQSVSFGAINGASGVLDVHGLRLRTIAVPPGASQAPALLAAMLDAAQAHALNAHRVDWSALRSRLLTDELASLPDAEAYARFREIARALGDRHSLALAPRDTSELVADARPSAAIASWSRDGVGYVAVPGLHGTDAAAGERFSAQLCAALAAARSDATRGWIVDLRANGGGNMWPMLAGLTPLLDSDRPGRFRYADGRTETWRIAPGPGCDWRAGGARVAVLIGPGTTSSGEAVAVAFRARPHTRFFGGATAGLSTSNQSFRLPDGGSAWITTAVDEDRAGVAYPEGLQPDEVIADGAGALDAALQWLTPPAR